MAGKWFSFISALVPDDPNASAHLRGGNFGKSAQALVPACHSRAAVLCCPKPGTSAHATAGNAIGRGEKGQNTIY